MGKALVLGGGGSVGTAWQTGLIAGWNRAGLVFTDADLILGTSAGAAVAVPGVYPPVTVAGRRYIDGGCLSTNHLDLAARHERILFVRMTDVHPGELAAVEASGAELFVVTPDAASAASFGDGLMDAGAAFDAAERGLEQGLRDAAGVKAFWHA